MGKKKKQTPQQPPPQPPPGASTLLLDEYFEQGDERFLQELFACATEQKFKTFSRKWYQDERPFAREMLYRYIEDGCDRAHHRLLVKRLFKLAETNKDTELMGRFVVTFDRLNKRKLQETTQSVGGREVTVKQLVPVKNPEIPEMFLTKQQSKLAKRFSRRTRLYLQRRAWRYFRFMGYQAPELYWREIKKVLLRYHDEALTKPEQFLDSWGLLHILYWKSPVLNRQPRGVVLHKGRALSELAPAPFCAKAWEGRFSELFALLFESESRTVRSFLRGLLTRDYKSDVEQLTVFQVKRLLLHKSDDLQEWGAALLKDAKGLEQLAISDWISLLQINNAMVAPVMAELAMKHIKARQLSLAECVLVAKAKISNVAHLGLSWCLQKPPESEADWRLLLQLGNAEIESVRKEAVDYLIGELVASPDATSEYLRELIDSKHEDIRGVALSTMQNDGRFRESLVLWGALAESPYQDVRGHLLQHLKEKEPSFAPGTLRALWASALLSIVKGSRTKQTVLKQLAERIIAKPEEAEEITSLLAIALRSVRAPERRGALAALAKAAFQKPQLREVFGKKLPELTLFSAEEAA